MNCIFGMDCCYFDYIENDVCLMVMLAVKLARDSGFPACIYGTPLHGSINIKSVWHYIFAS